MTSLKQTLLLAFLLAAAAVSITWYKVSTLGYPVTPDTSEQNWNLEIFVTFDGTGNPVKVALQLPSQDATGLITDERFFSGAYGLDVSSGSNRSEGRRATWTLRSATGPQALSYRAVLLDSDFGIPTAPPTPEEVEELTGPSATSGEDPLRELVLHFWSEDVRRQTADDPTFIKALIDEALGGEPSERVLSLLPSNYRPRDRVLLAAEVLRYNDVVTRVVNGIALSEARRDAAVLTWLEYWLDDEWARRQVPDVEDEVRDVELLPIWYGREELVSLTGGRNVRSQVSIAETTRGAINIAEDRARVTDAFVKNFDLFGLPVTTQLVYRILLTIPVGICLLLFLRQVVGVSTLGTFMPILIALAFRETALLTGVLLFSALIALGLMLRFYFEKLHLLLIPRLGAVLIFIVMCMLGMTMIFTGIYDQSTGLSVALFPMVIVTMTIERMSIIWEEYGASDALKQGFGSLAVAALAYVVMTDPQVEHWMFVFPETLLLLMAFALLLGRYTGLRLSELYRFRHLARAAAQK